MTAARVTVDVHDLLLLETYDAPVTVMADLLGRVELRDYREIDRPRRRRRFGVSALIKAVVLGGAVALLAYRIAQ